MRVRVFECVFCLLFATIHLACVTLPMVLLDNNLGLGGLETCSSLLVLDSAWSWKKDWFTSLFICRYSVVYGVIRLTVPAIQV